METVRRRTHGKPLNRRVRREQPKRTQRPKVTARNPEPNPKSQLPRRPLHVPSADQMDVNVEHGLSRFRSYVEDSAIAVFDSALASDGGGGQVQASNQFRVFRLSFLQATNMLLGNNQHMRRCLRIGVFEGKSVLVFVNFPGGDLAPDDAAEQAVSHELALG